MEQVEKEQEELPSCLNLYDNASMSSLNTPPLIADQIAEKSLLTFGDSKNSSIAIKKNNINSIQQNYHSALLPLRKISDEDKKNKGNPEVKEHSYKDFQKKHFLKIKQVENEENENVLNLSPSASRYSRSSPDKIDIFDLVMAFETMKSYKFYFPHNNSEVIISNISSLDFFRSKKKTIQRKHFRKSRVAKNSPMHSLGTISNSEASLNKAKLNKELTN